jgi:hypothetical protein
MATYATKKVISEVKSLQVLYFPYQNRPQKHILQDFRQEIFL